MPSPPQTCSQSAKLWIEHLPPEVLLHIARYVTGTKPGLFAANLATLGPIPRTAVCEALKYSLTGVFRTHAVGLVPQWVSLFHDVRTLQLCEHPPNFDLLSAPSLRIVEAEDEPFQLQALEKSHVALEKLILNIRYGTPPYLVCRILANISFQTLHLRDPDETFFRAVEPSEFADACKGVSRVIMDDYTAQNPKVVKFVTLMPSLRELYIRMEGYDILDNMLPVMQKLDNLWVTGSDLSLSKMVKAVRKTQTRLKQLCVYIAEGLWKEDMIAFGETVEQLPHLEKLEIFLQPGSERFFPKIPSLTDLTAYWYEETDKCHRPNEGDISKIVQGLPCLTTLRIYDVGLSATEVADVIKQMGDRLQVFKLSLDEEELKPHEILRAVIRSLTKYSRNLQSVHVPMLCDGSQLRWQTKREMLLELDRLHRSMPDADIAKVESLVMSWPEEHHCEQSDEEKNQEVAFRKLTEFRNCRNGMNDNGGVECMVQLAGLLETGYEKLEKDIDTAVQLLRNAVKKGYCGYGIITLWRLTESHCDKSSQPTPGGALELFLEMDRKRVTSLPQFARVFHRQVIRNLLNYRATVKLLETVVEMGYVKRWASKLADLLQEGYEEVEPDLGRAVELYRRAIDEDENDRAVCKISRILMKGYADVPPDPAGAKGFMERCATRTHCRECARTLGCMLRDGSDDVPQNHEEAVKMFKAAIDFSDRTAMCHLAKMYYDGYKDQTSSDTESEDPSSISKAVELLERAVEWDEVETAPLLLAKIYRKGYDDKPPNYERAIELCEKLKDIGDMRGCLMLADIFAEGYNEEGPDHEKAIRLYQQAMIDGKHSERRQAISGILKVLLKRDEMVSPSVFKEVRVCDQTVEAVEEVEDKPSLLLDFSNVEDGDALPKTKAELLQKLELLRDK